MTHRTASCSCGQLQAHVTSDPIRVSVCHCLACQRRTGSVFGAQARFSSTSVTIKGTSKEFVRVGDEGTQSTFRFCPECGSTMYYTAEGLERFIAVPVGAFADPKFPRPTFSVYEERMHSRISMPPDIEHMA
ncbi:MAG: GFA family protein [Casimicrobiaceae bacterium]